MSNSLESGEARPAVADMSLELLLGDSHCSSSRVVVLMLSADCVNSDGFKDLNEDSKGSLRYSIWKFAQTA